MVPQQSFSVLVVDDEAPLRRVICAALASGGFVVEEARNAAEALQSVRRASFDLALLDVNMPGMNGVELCRHIRAAAPGIGIVMATVLDAEDDKVHALEAGADDYVTKPFQFRELTARLSALLRRTKANTGAKTPVLHCGELTIDIGRRLLFRRSEEIRLSPKEFDLLAFLMSHRDAPLAHVTLLRGVWGAEYGGELEYLRTYIKMLRKKIEDNPARPRYIQTEPWVGYRFRNPADHHPELLP